MTRVLIISLCFTTLLKEGLGIIGGDEVKPHSIPYQAYLSVTGSGGRTWRCGGSLISTHYVLTAAQCCSGATSVDIILGAHNISSEEDTQVRFSSKNFTVHSNFTTDVPVYVYEMDIAVIALPQQVELNDNIQIVRLPSSLHPFKYTNRKAKITGWGLTDSSDNTSYSSVLRSQENTIISNEECSSRPYFDINDFDICMDTNKTSSPCVGDYGSPLIVDDVQVGIMSQDINCIPGYPALYTRVSEFLSWIVEVSDYEDKDFGTTTTDEPETELSSSDTTESVTTKSFESTTEWTSTTTGSAPDSILPISKCFLIYLVLTNIFMLYV